MLPKEKEQVATAIETIFTSLLDDYADQPDDFPVPLRELIRDIGYSLRSISREYVDLHVASISEWVTVGELRNVVRRGYAEAARYPTEGD